jgi:hypothetical protein
MLLDAVLGHAVTYFAAPMLVVLARDRHGWRSPLATDELALMSTLRFYRRSLLWAPFLPAIASVYMSFTLDNAYQHMRGCGGMWKGRAQGPPARGR